MYVCIERWYVCVCVWYGCSAKIGECTLVGFVFLIFFSQETIASAAIMAAIVGGWRLEGKFGRGELTERKTEVGRREHASVQQKKKADRSSSTHKKMQFWFAHVKQWTILQLTVILDWVSISSRFVLLCVFFFFLHFLSNFQPNRQVPGIFLFLDSYKMKSSMNHSRKQTVKDSNEMMHSSSCIHWFNPTSPHPGRYSSNGFVRNRWQQSQGTRKNYRVACWKHTSGMRQFSWSDVAATKQELIPTTFEYIPLSINNKKKRNHLYITHQPYLIYQHNSNSTNYHQINNKTYKT